MAREIHVLARWNCWHCSSSNRSLLSYCNTCGMGRTRPKKAVKKRAPKADAPLITWIPERKKKEVRSPTQYIVPDHFEFDRVG